jgi:tryptophan 2,3-dioxygenase
MSDSNAPDDSTLRPPPPMPGQLTYGSYLRISELLSLQKLEVGDQSHDELLFITIHQAYELWFKQILFELDTVARLIPHGELREARRLVDRVVQIERLLVDQIHILETMTPRDFCHFRQALSPASGFQSAQFRELEFLSGLGDPSYLKYHTSDPPAVARLEKRLIEPSLRDVLYDACRARGVAIGEQPDLTPEKQAQAARLLLPLYTDPDSDPLLYDLCESLVAHDEWMVFWRFHHVRVVERIIGYKIGTGGSHGVRYLDNTVQLRAFPVLWMARGLLDEQTLFARYTPPT